VLEAIRDVPAVIGDTNNHPWTNEDRDRNAAATAEAIKEPLDRLMVALAVSYANPVQEHLAHVGALYAGGSLGRNPLPIGAALINPPPGGYPELDIERLKRNAEIVAKVRDVKIDRRRSSPLLHGHCGESAAGRQAHRPRHRDRGTNR